MSDDRLIHATALLTALSGLTHLLVPDLLLRNASRGYDRVLAVDFEPREASTRRVRLLGVLSLAAAAVCYRVADST